MSRDAEAWAWAQKDNIESNEKWVLMALAYMENNETRICNPSITYIADQCRLSERRTRDIIHRLRDKGFLQVRPQKSSAGDFTSNRYLLAHREWGGDAIAPPNAIGVGTERSVRVGTQRPQGVGTQRPQGWGNPTSNKPGSSEQRKMRNGKAGTPRAHRAAQPALTDDRAMALRRYREQMEGSQQ